MRSFLSTSALCLTLTAGFWYCLTTTLDKMTEADCRAGIQRACDSLR